MIRERQYVFLRLNLLLDMALALLALVAAYYTRSLLAPLWAGGVDVLPWWLPEMVPYEKSHLLREYAWLFPTCAVLWPLALNRWGYYDLYDPRHTRSRRVTIVKASVLSTALLILVIFVFKQQFIARVVIVSMGIWTTLALWLKESIMRRVLVRLHQQPEYQHAVVVVADDQMGALADRLIEHYRDWGVLVVQRLPLQGIQADAFAAALTQQPVDEVVLAPAPGSYAMAPTVLYVCEQLGVTTRIIVDLYQPLICKMSTEIIDGAPVIELHPTTQNFAALTVKLFFDRSVAALLLLASLPFLLIVALGIRLTSRGPVLIRQARVGQNGRVFAMVKFRSMVAQAETMRATLEPANELQGWAFKLRHDPRITPLGRMLRRFSIDELPQLWNVLMGDMSLVGPRPALPAEVDKFQLWERRRCSMKPGMTGLWQVSGRTQLPNEDWVACDLKYIDTWRPALDLRILLKTIWVVISGQGQ